MKRILIFLLFTASAAIGQTAQPQRAMYGTKSEVRAYPGLSRVFVVVPNLATSGLRTQETFVKDPNDSTSPESDSVIVAAGGVRFKRVSPVSTVSISMVSWVSGISGKPETFPPATHNHTLSTLTGYAAFAAAKQDTIGSGATNQILTWGRVWRTPDKAWFGLNNVPNVDATNANNLGSGSIPTGRFGVRTIPNTAIAQSGATDGQTIKWSASLNAWVPAADNSSGTTSWGGLSGSLSSQSDLQAALDAKAVATRNITAGTGLTGGGTLAADRTISIANDGVTNSKLDNMAQRTLKGRADGVGTGDPTDIDMLALPVSTATQSALDVRVLTVANIATLKTTTGVSGQIATTSGYYSASDGGGNSYYWNASSTDSQNNGSIIQVTGVSTGRWLSVEQTEVLAKKWGAKGDGSTDDTAALTAALAYAVSNSKVLVLTEGDYKVTNYLLNNTTYSGSENLAIRIVGNVKITVPTGNSAINTSLITYGKTTTGNVSITGDILTVELNNKCRGFLELRNTGTVSGTSYVTVNGECTIRPSSLTIRESYASSSGDGSTYALAVIGTFKRITIENVTVDSVTRYNAAYGESKGIVVTALKGDCLINNCKVGNVLTNALYNLDADGIAVFGLKENAAMENSFRTGTTKITNCTLTDNQGRSIKIQTSESEVTRNNFYRQYVVGIDNSHDVDIQFGNGKITNNTAVYKKNGSTSPLGTYFAAFKFQQVLPNKEMYSLAENNTIYTEAVIPYVFFITHGNSLSPDSVKTSITEVVNNHVINTGTFVGTGAVQRGFCEFNADEVAKVVGGKHQINVRNNSFYASSTSALLSYNNAIYNIKSKLTFRVVDNKNTNTSLTPFLFHNYFSGQVDSVDTYQVWANQGFSESFHTTWKINLSKGKIIAPSRIAFDLYYHSLLTNKPPTVGTSGNAIISILGDWGSGNAKVELYENTGGSNDYLHYTTSASTWKKATLN